MYPGMWEIPVAATARRGDLLRRSLQFVIVRRCANTFSIYGAKTELISEIACELRTCVVACTV